MVLVALRSAEIAVEVLVGGPSRLQSRSETFLAAQLAQNASCNTEVNVGHCPRIAPSFGDLESWATGLVEGGMFGLSQGVQLEVPSNFHLFLACR